MELKRLDTNTYTFRTKMKFKQLERGGVGGGMVVVEGGGGYEQRCNPSNNTEITTSIRTKGGIWAIIQQYFPRLNLRWILKCYIIYIIKYVFWNLLLSIREWLSDDRIRWTTKRQIALHIPAPVRARGDLAVRDLFARSVPPFKMAAFAPTSPRPSPRTPSSRQRGDSIH